MKKLIYNAKRIHTRNCHTDADSILIDGDRIAAIGSREQFTSEIRQGITLIDADQAVILPGFIDAHNHFCYMAEVAQKIDLGGLFDKQSIIEKLRNESQKIPEDAPILAYNWEFDSTHLDIRLNETDLDPMFSDRLIQIEERTGHFSVTNKYTLSHAGIDWNNTGCCSAWNPSKFTGEVCGKVNSRLGNFFKDLLFSPENLRHCLQEAEQSALAKGVTGMHVICSEADFPVLHDFQKNLTLNLHIFTETKDTERIHSLGLKQIGGCGAVMVDGDTSAKTAALFEPYIDNPGNKGILYYSDEELYDYVRSAHSRNMQIGLHCVGDAASDQLIRTIERLQKEDPRPIRHRIEHFEFATDEMISRVKDAGICLSVQPVFNLLWPHESYYPDLGPNRAKLADRIASPINAGIHVAFGSDCPVTPCDPLLAIHAAVNHSNPSERISPETAIDCHTWQAAYAGCEESERGSIEPGKIADLVFLTDDPLSVPTESIRDIRVLQTMSKAEIVYSV